MKEKRVLIVVTPYVLALYAISSTLAILDVLGVVPSQFPYTAVKTLLGFVFGSLHGSQRLGWLRAGMLAVLVFITGLAFESIGVATGVIFGPYHYTDLLGPKFLGLVPYLIPIAWFMMVYPSYVIADRLVAARKSVFARILLVYFLEHQQLPERLTEHVQVIEGRPQQRVPLFLLPAGNPRWAKYWQTLARVDWRTLIYEEPRAGIPLFLELKARLEAEYRLDYLLIDARTGVTEVGGLATAILPDTLVCFFANNDESFDGTQAVIQGSLERRSQQRVVPVLTRVSAAPDEILKRNALQHLNEGLDETLRQKALLDVCLLHTEPALELRERLLLDVEDAAAALPLTLDYLDLLRHLAPETALDEINRLAKTDIAKDASQKAVDAIIVEMAGGAPDLAAARRNALDERLAYFRAMGVSRLAGEPHGTEHLKIYLDLIRQRSTLDAERSRQRLDETVEVLRELSQRERKYERELQEQAAVRDHMRLQEEGRRLQTLSQSERHEEVLAALQGANGPMKLGEIAELVRKKKNNVHKLLAGLIASGKVTKIGYGTYEALKVPEPAGDNGQICGESGESGESSEIAA